MQSASSRIWTRIAVSISSDDNHYTTGKYHYRIWKHQYAWLPGSDAFGSNGIEGVLHTTQISSLASLVSYSELDTTYSSTENVVSVFLVY